MKVFITGATGLIGRALVAALVERGDSVVALTRNRAKAERFWPRESTTDRLEIVEGDSGYEGAWQQHIAGCDAVVNLAGEPIDGERWDARFRQKLHDSRIDSTRFVAEAICRVDNRPKVLVSASGLDYYGFSELAILDEDEITESDPGGESFLSALCWDWEDETRVCKEAGVRVVLMRTGTVLATHGSLRKLTRPFRLRAGGQLGSGRQWMSWIHIDDVVGGYLHALDGHIQGAVNLVSPGNARNREFARVSARVLGRKSWLHVPKFVLQIILGQLHEYVVKGRRAAPAKLLQSGYSFAYPELEGALRNLLK